MNTRVAALVGVLLAPAWVLGQTAEVSLSSASDGQVVAPGATVAWSIDFTVSAGDNDGLALLIADLVQDPGNPQLFDLPPADGVPAGMLNFSRPDGICNPGELNPTTGYPGVQRGTPGAMNLRQIGGSQNTFGVALPPGTGVAENAIVIGAIGQGAPERLASGSFAAPSACGAYTLSLENVRGNVLAQRNDPPDFSPAVRATITGSNTSITFIVGVLGDIDGNGGVDLGDLSVLLSNFGTPSGATYAMGDIDGDGDIDLGDLSVVLANFGQSCG